MLRDNLQHYFWVVSQKLDAFGPLVVLGLREIFSDNCVLFLNKIDDFFVVDSFTLVLAHRHTLNFVDNVE